MRALRPTKTLPIEQEKDQRVGKAKALQKAECSAGTQTGML